MTFIHDWRLSHSIQWSGPYVRWAYKQIKHIIKHIIQLCLFAFCTFLVLAQIAFPPLSHAKLATQSLLISECFGHWHPRVTASEPIMSKAHVAWRVSCAVKWTWHYIYLVFLPYTQYLGLYHLNYKKQLYRSAWSLGCKHEASDLYSTRTSLGCDCSSWWAHLTSAAGFIGVKDTAMSPATSFSENMELWERQIFTSQNTRWEVQ